jgi:hypothetical protein
MQWRSSRRCAAPSTSGCIAGLFNGIFYFMCDRVADPRLVVVVVAVVAVVNVVVFDQGQGQMALRPKSEEQPNPRAERRRQGGLSRASVAPPLSAEGQLDSRRELGRKRGRARALRHSGAVGRLSSTWSSGQGTPLSTPTPV